VTRESAEAKGRRYLAEGRLVVRAVRGCEASGACRGGGKTYAVEYRPATGWRCSCPARGICAHLVALRLVIDVSAAAT